MRSMELRIAEQDHLSSYSRPITTEPYMVQTDVGRLIGDFERQHGQELDTWDSWFTDAVQMSN